MEYPVPAGASRTPGMSLADTSYDLRSQFETAVRTRFKTATPLSSWTMTPLQDIMGIVTPSGLHFERSHGGTAVIDPARHALYVHGLVKRARRFTIRDLRRLPSVSRVHFIECSGNGLTERSKPTMKTVQGTHGLTS
jgi:sulfane dehydrogenase subunit SoxC